MILFGSLDELVVTKRNPMRGTREREEREEKRWRWIDWKKGHSPINLNEWHFPRAFQTSHTHTNKIHSPKSTSRTIGQASSPMVDQICHDKISRKRYIGVWPWLEYENDFNCRAWIRFARMRKPAKCFIDCKSKWMSSVIPRSGFPPQPKFTGPFSKRPEFLALSRSCFTM